MFDTPTHPLRRFRAEDRRERSRFAMPERRTGFDRRRHPRVLAFIRDHPPVLAVMLIATSALSLLDWALTRNALAHGAVEANPILAPYIQTDPVGSLVFKVGLTIAVAASMWAWRRYRLVLATALGFMLLYGALTAYHVYGLTSLAH